MSGVPGCAACEVRAQGVLRALPAVTLTDPPERVDVLLCNYCLERPHGAWRWRWRLLDAADDPARGEADDDQPDLRARGERAIAILDREREAA